MDVVLPVLGRIPFVRQGVEAKFPGADGDIGAASGSLIAWDDGEALQRSHTMKRHDEILGQADKCSLRNRGCKKKAQALRKLEEEIRS